jgi:hypothetical protein
MIGFCRHGAVCRCVGRTATCLDCGGWGWSYRWGCSGSQAVMCSNCAGSGRIPIRPPLAHRPTSAAPRYCLHPLRRAIHLA